jgi:gamma-glutamyltranspeptidase/glutathione hydrolase
MGGYMQPQGHMQLTVGLIAAGMDAQSAVDFPRFCIADGTQNGSVHLEIGVEDNEVVELKRRGHDLVANVGGHDRAIFGRAQIIQRHRTSGVLWAGSDGRADGCAMGY